MNYRVIAGGRDPCAYYEKWQNQALPDYYPLSSPRPQANPFDRWGQRISSGRIAPKYEHPGAILPGHEENRQNASFKFSDTPTFKQIRAQQPAPVASATQDSPKKNVKQPALYSFSKPKNSPQKFKNTAVNPFKRGCLKKIQEYTRSRVHRESQTHLIIARLAQQVETLSTYIIELQEQMDVLRQKIQAKEVATPLIHQVESPVDPSFTVRFSPNFRRSSEQNDGHSIQEQPFSPPYQGNIDSPGPSTPPIKKDRSDKKA